MKKNIKLFTTILGIAIVLFLNDNIFAKNSKQNIFVANVQLIFQESNAGKNANLELETKKKEMNKTLEEMSKKIENLQNTLERESMVMDEKILEKKKRDLRIRINDLKLLKRKFQNELEIFQQKLLSKIEKEIINIASKIGSSEGYSLIINKSAVLYSKDSINITNKILEIYNSKNTTKEKK